MFNDGAHHIANGGRRGRLGGVDAHAFADQGAFGQIDETAFDAGATDVDA